MNTWMHNKIRWAKTQTRPRLDSPPPSVVKTTGTHCTQYVYEVMNNQINICILECIIKLDEQRLRLGQDWIHPPPSVVKTTGTHCTQYIYEDMNKYTNIWILKRHKKIRYIDSDSAKTASSIRFPLLSVVTRSTGHTHTHTHADREQHPRHTRTRQEQHFKPSNEHLP